MGGRFWVAVGVLLSLRDVVIVMSWVRLQQASDWIPHPYWMYAKCFGTLIWCEWSYGSTIYTGRHVQVGAYFFFLGGVDLSQSDVVISRLRLVQQASDCIPHSYWMYTKCFGSLRWCEWAYGSTLTLLCYPCAGGGNGLLGVDLYPSDVVMSWLRLQEASVGTFTYCL